MEKGFCQLCGEWSDELIELKEDSSCFDPVRLRRQWVPAGLFVCEGHRPQTFIPERRKVQS